MKVLFFSFLMILMSSCAPTAVVVIQLLEGPVRTGAIDIAKPGNEVINLKADSTNSLESFLDKDDAIIYIYRLSSMTGAAVKWKIQIDNDKGATLGQKEYTIRHINTIKKDHYLYKGYSIYHYINFQPNRYYYMRFKGFSYKTGSLDEKSFNEIIKCDRIKSNSQERYYFIK